MQPLFEENQEEVVKSPLSVELDCSLFGFLVAHCNIFYEIFCHNKLIYFLLLNLQ